MKKRRMKEAIGTEQLIRATLRQWRKVPSRNWARMPRITAIELVEESMPRRWGWAISAR